MPILSDVTSRPARAVCALFLVGSLSACGGGPDPATTQALEEAGSVLDMASDVTSWDVEGDTLTLTMLNSKRDSMGAVWCKVLTEQLEVLDPPDATTIDYVIAAAGG